MSPNELWERISAEVGKVVVGQEEVLRQIFSGLLANGHVLIEGVPGIAKTLMAKAMARALGLTFSRIQFTPDLMPSDVTGTMVFEMQSATFRFKRGPIFANIVLADEINRTPPKTQSALLEAMEERQVTVDGTPYLLPKPFFVLATLNPIEYEGTYPLPEAQLDRFLLKVIVDYPEENHEREILHRAHKGVDIHRRVETEVQPVADAQSVWRLKLLLTKSLSLTKLSTTSLRLFASLVNFLLSGWAHRRGLAFTGSGSLRLGLLCKGEILSSQMMLRQ